MPSSLSCWEGSICGWRRCSCVATGGLGWQSPYAQQIFLLCFFSVLQSGRKESFPGLRSCANRSARQRSHQRAALAMLADGKDESGICSWLCDGFLSRHFIFHELQSGPQKVHPVWDSSVLWAQEDKCVRQWALSWGIACCPTILPLQRAYLLFSHSLTTLSCQGILRDSSVFGNNRSCRALQKVWLCPLGVKEGPQVPGKSGPKKVQKHTFCQEVNKISLKLSQGQRWKSRWPMTNCENEFVRMTWE